MPPLSHSQDGLGQGWLRLKWAKGQFWSKIDEKVKVLRMEFSIVENLSGLQESIFNLSRGPQLHFGEKSKNWSNFIKFIDFPPFPLFGVPWAAVIVDKNRPLAHIGLGPFLAKIAPGGIWEQWQATGRSGAKQL